MKTLGKVCTSYAAVLAFVITCQSAHAQTAGTQTIGVTVEQDSIVLNGWSAKKSLLGKTVYNNQGQRVGVLHDIIVAPNNAVSFAIVAAHQFLGVSQHDVAVPLTEIDAANGKLIWAGATRDAVKNTPAFQYTKVRITPVSRAEYDH